MHSVQFRKFKKEMGQANHFLITILVGLDAVEDGAQKRESFQTTWNPQNTNFSVSRSRHYAIKSALAWTVDNLDMYLRLCNRLPRLYSGSESAEISNTKLSVYNKLIVILKNHNEIPISQSAYVDLLICWRNNLIHFDAENQLSSESNRYFKNIPSDDIIANKYHLDAEQMLSRFQAKECPTFKEITSLISMTIHFVEDLDASLLANIDQYEFLKQTLSQILHLDEKNIQAFSHRNTTSFKRQKRIKQLLASNGIPNTFYNDAGQRFLDEFSHYTPEQVYSKL